MKKLLALLIIPMGLWGQTNPTAFDLSTGNFSFTSQTASNTSYPTNMQGWTTGTNNIATLTTAAPAGNQTLVASGTASTSGLSNLGTDGFNFLSTGSSPNQQVGAICVAINSTGRSNILVNWLVDDQTAGSTREMNITLQYRVGTSGTFTTVASSTYTTDNTANKASQTFTNVSLPSACDNQSTVQLRWITYESAAQSGGRDAIRLDEISITSSPSCTPPANPAGSISQTNNCESVDLVYSGTPTNIYWQTSATGTSLTNPVSSNLNMTSTGTRHARAYDGTSCWSVSTVSSTVSSIPNNSTISSHPSNRSIVTAANTSFSVTATNSPSYQWQVNPGSGFTNITNGGVYSNATTNTLNITAATLSLSGYTYRCVVTSASPCTNVVNSNSATLTITDGPCLSQNFNSFTSGAPSGWSGTGCSNYNTTASSGLSPNSAQFNSTGDFLETPTTTNGARSLAFWHLGNGTSGASALLIEGFDGASWTTIQNITTLPTTGTIKTYTSSTTPALPEGMIKFKFTYTKDVGNVAFDDVEVFCDNCKANVATQSTPGTYNYTVQCPSYDAWNYYGNGNNYYFAINKNGNTFTPTVDITVSSAAVDSSKSSNGGNQEHASYLMKRYWNVNCGGCTPTTNGGVSVRFFYDPADSTAAHNAMRAGFLALKASNVNTLADTTTSMQWVKNNTSAPYAPSMFSGNKMTVAHLKLSPTYGTLNGVRYVEFSGIQSFSGGGGGFGFGPPGGGGVGLPVTWAGFDASVQRDYTELIWHTASEQNTSHFEVEASIDGKNFKTISENIAAAGNNASLLSYSFRDMDLAPIKYYRLKQVDIEGTFEYSKIIVAKRSEGEKQGFDITVYPVSENNNKEYHLLLKNKIEDISAVQIVDYTGKPVFHMTSSKNAELLDLRYLTPGIYMIQVWNGEEKQVERVVVR
jgi:hypothetical protein